MVPVAPRYLERQSARSPEEQFEHVPVARPVDSGRPEDNDRELSLNRSASSSALSLLQP